MKLKFRIAIVLILSSYMAFFPPSLGKATHVNPVHDAVIQCDSIMQTIDVNVKQTQLSIQQLKQKQTIIKLQNQLYEAVSHK